MKTSFIAEDFTPRRRLRGGHWQTIAGNFLRRQDSLPPAEAEMVEVEKPASVLCHSHWQPNAADATTIIILHGLEGSSASQYMIGVGNKAWAAGMNVVRMNMRTCGGTESLAPTLYHNGLGADVGAVVEELVRSEGLKRVAMVGYSMGGNLVLKIAGEWADQAPPQFRAVVAVCPSMDLAPSADALHQLSNRLYEIYFLFRLRGRLRTKARCFPEAFDTARLRGVRSLRDFDEQITAYYSGFAGADDYYSRASASNVVDRITTPALLIHAANDPFVRILPETRKKVAANPHIQFIEPPDGGHCSFLAEPNGYDGHWAERRVVNFLRTFQSPPK